MKFATQPDEVHVPLFKYQRHAIYLLEEFERTKRISSKGDGDNENSGRVVNSDIVLYADKVGAGKTLTIIGLIARDLKEVTKYEKMCYQSFDTICISQLIPFPKEDYVNATLVLCSVSLISQWEKELDKTDLSYYTIDKKSKLDSFSHTKVNKKHHIVLCSATMFKFMMQQYSHLFWKRFVIDEADSIKIPSMQRVYSDTTILVTATPSFITTVMGRNHWIHSMFYIPKTSKIVMDYKDIMIKNDDEFIDRCQGLPPPEVITHQCLPSVMTKVMQDIVPQHISELLNSGDITGAVEALGGTSSNENIMDLVSKNILIEIENAKHTLNLHISQNSNKQQIDYWENKINEYKNKLNIINERFSNILAEDCGICLSNKTNPTMLCCCQNIACGRCVVECIQTSKKCPFCRNSSPQIIHIKGSESEESVEREKKKINDDCDNEIHSKNDVLLDIINCKKHKKILVFCTSDNSITNLKNILKENDVNFRCIKGNKMSRDKYIRDFKNGDIRVLMINSRINGSGIDLPCTTDIVLYHKMPAEIEEQCIGRGQRQGRKKPLRIHRFDND